jgi:hypothetical protein
METTFIRSAANVIQSCWMIHPFIDVQGVLAKGTLDGALGRCASQESFRGLRVHLLVAAFLRCMRRLKNICAIRGDDE